MIYHDLPISSHRMAKLRWTCCQKQPDHSLCFSAHQTYSKAYIQPATGLVQPECSKSISKFKRVRHPCLLHDLNLNYPGMCQMVSNPINSASEKYTCALERKGLITNYTLLHTWSINVEQSMDNTTYMCVCGIYLYIQHLRMIPIDYAGYKYIYIYICNLLSIFTGSCFACGISLPLCFIIAQVPKKKHMEPSSSKLMLLAFFFPLCAVHCFWCMRVLCIHPGWEKIGLWIPLNDLFSQIKKK